MNIVFSKIGLVLSAVLTVVLLGASYAGYTSTLAANISIGTGNMDFEFFGENEDFSIAIQKGENNSIKPINANINFDGKELAITDMDPINMEFLKDGNLRIIIQYSVCAADNSSIKKAAYVNSGKTTKAQFINIQRSSRTLKWRVESGSGNWAFGDSDYGDVPEIIYQLMPETLGTFQVEQIFAERKDRDKIHGRITLVQNEIPDLLSVESITLGSLALPREVAAELMGKGDLQLIMEGCYDFTIPLILDQFNTEKSH